MNFILDGLRQAIVLIFNLNRDLLNVALISLVVSFSATILASLVGVPIGFLIGIKKFWGKRILTVGFNTLMALPTVVVGLLVYSLISRRGMFGPLGLLYTPGAMIIGQFILIVPLIAALTIAAVSNIDKRIVSTVKTLGASRIQSFLTIFFEARFVILAAVIAGFGRVFSEVGISMMLGGNIRGYTRNITTTIALETGRGEFALGIALGIVLLTVAFTVNIIFHLMQRDNYGSVV